MSTNSWNPNPVKAIDTHALLNLKLSMLLLSCNRRDSELTFDPAHGVDNDGRLSNLGASMPQGLQRFQVTVQVWLARWLTIVDHVLRSVQVCKRRTWKTTRFESTNPRSLKKHQSENRRVNLGHTEIIFPPNKSIKVCFVFQVQVSSTKMHPEPQNHYRFISTSPSYELCILNQSICTHHIVCLNLPQSTFVKDVVITSAMSTSISKHWFINTATK